MGWGPKWTDPGEVRAAVDELLTAWAAWRSTPGARVGSDRVRGLVDELAAARAALADVDQGEPAAGDVERMHQAAAAVLGEWFSSAAPDEGARRVDAAVDELRAALYTRPGLRASENGMQHLRPARHPNDHTPPT